MDTHSEKIGIPTTSELLAASALLAAYPGLAARFPEEEVAITEYCYYSTQTYIFEVVGFQILGDMACKLRSFDFVHELASQARDEAEHAETYRHVVRDLPVNLLPVPLEAHATPIYDAFVKGGSIEERVVSSYMVLESIAMGIFAARQRCYRISPLAQIDHRILADEASHQSMGVKIVAELVREGRIDVDDVHEIVRSAVRKIGELLMPDTLFERFDICGSPSDRAKLLSSGFLAVQHATSQKAILNSLRSLNRALSVRPEPRTRKDESDARAA